jgi:hypothetical protein
MNEFVIGLTQSFCVGPVLLIVLLDEAVYRGTGRTSVHVSLELQIRE